MKPQKSMKTLLVLVALTLVLTLGMTACSNRGNVPPASQPNTSSLAPLPPASSSLPPASSRQFEESISDTSPAESATSQPVPGTSGSRSGTSSSNGNTSGSVATMSTDLNQIGALNGEKIAWGSGSPKDKENRPLSSLQFNDKYSEWDAVFISADTPTVYLTFDMGYEAGYTAKILDVLKEKNAKGLFFITGHYAESAPELVKRMIAEGHTVGNHTDKHPSLPTVTLERAATEIGSLQDYVSKQFHYDMEYFRFPYGEFSERTLGLAKSMKLTPVFWSFAYVDYDAQNSMDPTEALKRLDASIANGEILLMHAVNETNGKVLGDFIDHVRQKGMDIGDPTAL